MREKTEQILGPISSDFQESLWKGANFVTIAATTSMAIVAVQAPLKTGLINLTKNGTIIPPVTGGLFGLAKAFYAGTSASLGGSTVRTVYVTHAKNAKPNEESVSNEVVTKKECSKISNFGYIAAMAGGEILVTNIPESLSTLKKVPGLLPAHFKWATPYNAYKLLTGGFIPRFGSGLINFMALCVLEEKISETLVFQDKNLSHFVAGAFSGGIAAFFAYPLASFKDYVQVQSTVKEGKLYNKGTYTVAKEIFYSFKASPSESMLSFVKMGAKQLPIRMLLTGAVFATVAGVGAALDKEPLSKIVPEEYQPSSVKSRHGFFVQENSHKATENTPSSTETMKKIC